MMLQIYSVRDNAIQAYLPPFYARARGEAIRMVQGIMQDPNTNFNRHPEQFALYLLGEFDDASGNLIAVENPERVITCLELKEPEQ